MNEITALARKIVDSLATGTPTGPESDAQVQQVAALLSAAQFPVVDPDIEPALTRALNTAMIHTLKAPIPQCGEFGAIAQDLGYIHDALFSPEAKATFAARYGHRVAHALLVSETMDALGSGLGAAASVISDLKRREEQAPFIGKLVIEPNAIDLILEPEEIKAILLMSGEGEDMSSVRLQSGEGHSGRGLYACCAEYPEEGSVFVMPLKP